MSDEDAPNPAAAKDGPKINYSKKLELYKMDPHRAVAVDVDGNYWAVLYKTGDAFQIDK